MNSAKTGYLYIAATPIGNLEDISLRVLRLLREADIIACEDTRKTGLLLKHFGIEAKRLLSYYSHNENQRIPQLLQALAEGLTVVQVSDAGTPGLSDPGNRLVTAAAAAGITVVPLPGASALTALLQVCHFPARTFHFEGFLPTKKGRQTRLRHLGTLKDAIVLYESTHRILKCLSELREHLGDRQCLVGRELTKLHETLFRGRLSEAETFFSEHSIKGEFTLIVQDKEEDT